MSKAYKLHKIKFSKDKKIIVILKNGTVWYPSSEDIEALLKYKNKKEELSKIQKEMEEMDYE